MSQHQNLSELIKHKKEAKKALAKELHMSKKGPLAAIFLDKEPKKNEATLIKVVEGAAAIGVNVVVLTDQDHKNVMPKNAKWLEYSRANRKKLLEAADIALGFSFNDIEEMLLHGTIPVSLKRPEILDYNPTKESGNAFIYKKNDQWDAFAAIVRAAETFKFPYDWKHIVRQGIESVGKTNLA